MNAFNVLSMRKSCVALEVKLKYTPPAWKNYLNIDGYFTAGFERVLNV